LLAVSPDGVHALLAADEGLGLWDLTVGRMIQHVRLNDGGALSAALTADGQRAVVGSGDLSTARFNLRFWSLNPWTELRCVEGQRWVGSMSGHTNSITAVDTTPQGEVVVSGSSDRSVRVWDFNGDLKAVLRGHDAPVRRVAIVPGKRAALSVAGATLCRWSLESHRPASSYRHDGSVGHFLHAQGQRVICSFDRYGGNCLWDLRDLRAIQTVKLDLRGLRPLALGERALFGVRVPQDPKTLVERDTLVAWNFSTKDLIAELPMRGKVGSAALTPDGSRLVVTLDSGPLAIVDVATWQEVGSIDVPVHGAQHLALVDEGRLLVAASDYQMIRLWDVASGSEEWALDNVTGIADLSVAADGTRAVSGTEFGRIHVWDLARCCLEHELIHGDHTQNFSVMATAITPDGSRILSGGTDNNVRVWDAASGSPIATFIAEDWTMCGAALTQDLFVAGSQNGAVHVLSLE
jgi:WD40 repeat protein